MDLSAILNAMKAGMDADEKKEYGKRLNKVECTCGSMAQNLNLPLDHGVYFRDDDHPMLNANDHVKGEHILQFGRCNSKSNPENAVSDFLSKFVPIVGVVNGLKKAMGSEGCKCKPMTLTSWKEGDDFNRLDGAPATLECSQCVCVYGGVIQIVEEKQETSQNKDEEENQSQEQPPDILDSIPPEMKEKINQMNMAGGMAQDAEEWYLDAGISGMDSIGGMAALACSPMVLAQNAIYNATQIPSLTSMNSEGYLVDAMELSNFNIAGTTVAAIGNVAMAGYNVMRALESQVAFADMISLVEQSQTVPGYMDVGPTAVNLMTMQSCVEKCGFTPAVMRVAAFLDDIETMEEGDVAVIAKSNRRLKQGESEFTTLRHTARGLVCMEHPETSIPAMLKEMDHDSTMVMSVPCQKKRMGMSEGVVL